MKKVYNSRPIGKCLTEHKLENFNEVKSKCVFFFRVSQFEDVNKLNVEKMNHPLTKEMPSCGYGEKVYGILEDRSTIKLIEIVDSSD